MGKLIFLLLALACSTGSNAEPNATNDTSFQSFSDRLKMHSLFKKQHMIKDLDDDSDEQVTATREFQKKVIHTIAARQK